MRYLAQTGLCLCLLGGTGVAQNTTYENPQELSVMLRAGYEIVAVLQPNLATPDMGLNQQAFEGNQRRHLQREIYMQRGSEAAICFFDVVRADGDCYDLTSGERN